MKQIIAACAVLMLSACTIGTAMQQSMENTFGPRSMPKPLQSYVGMSESTLVQQVGKPDLTTYAGGDKFFLYRGQDPNKGQMPVYETSIRDGVPVVTPVHPTLHVPLENFCDVQFTIRNEQVARVTRTGRPCS